MNHFYIQRRCIISGCKIQCQNLDTNKAIDMYKRYDLRKKKSCLIWTSLIGVDVWYLILEQFRNCTEALFVYSRFCALLKLSNWQIYLNRFIVVDVLVFSSAINPAILHFYCIMQKFQASWWCFVLQINTYFGSLRSKVISLLNRLITHRVIKFCHIFFINPKALNFYPNYYCLYFYWQTSGAKASISIHLIIFFVGKYISVLFVMSCLHNVLLTSICAKPYFGSVLSLRIVNKAWQSIPHIGMWS